MAGALAASGFLKGAAPDDKDLAAFEKNILGIQPYSVQIGDKSYTYDWLQPLGTTLAICADVAESIKTGKEITGGESGSTAVKAILNALSTGGNVMYEQSFLQGVKTLFGSENISDGLINLVAGIPTMFMPTFVNQVGQAIDPTVRNTYEYNNVIGSTKK